VATVVVDGRVMARESTGRDCSGGGRFVISIRISGFLIACTGIRRLIDDVCCFFFFIVIDVTGFVFFVFLRLDLDEFE
jgi:hypothetical protein